MSDLDTLVPLEDGPWDGMLDSIAPTARKAGRYLLGQNLYPLDPEVGDGVVGRPGCRQVGLRLGVPATRRGQGFYQFTKKNGTEFSVAIVGGKFYTLDWVNDIWTEVLTTANLTVAGITLDPTAKIAFLTISDKMMVSDGVNTPWLWDGTTGAGLTKLTNAPVFYGQPTVHFARIMGIKAADRTTFVWSETDTPNTGYEAGGYNNAWTLTQTDSARLERIVGSNEGLWVFRGRSGTFIPGPVTQDWSTAGTRESLSITEGTSSPFAVEFSGTAMVVLDSDMHPQLFRAGSPEAVRIWQGFRETTKAIPRTPAHAARCMAISFSPAQLILIAVPAPDGTECSALLVYDVKNPADPREVAVWTGWELTAMGMLKSGRVADLGTPFLFHGDTTGYVYRHGNPEDSSFITDDELNAGTVAIEHVLECQSLGYSTKREKIFDRIDLSVRALSNMTLEVSYTTPRGESVAQTVAVSTGDPGWDASVWDFLVWDSGSASGREAHVDVGIDDQARWIRPKVRHAVIGEQFGMVALTVAAYVTDDDPEVP